MKNLIWTIAFLFIVLSARSQNEKAQWASRVTSFSSQRSTDEYSVKQVLGKPDVLPGGGENIYAWQPAGNGKEEFIVVAFSSPIRADYIVIAESFHPGYITRVIAMDESGKEYGVAKYEPQRVRMASRYLNVKISSLNVAIASVKLVLQPEPDVPTAIDAIGLLASDQPMVLLPPKKVPAKVVTKLPGNINSIYAEMGPLITPDGKTLYFSRSGDTANVGGKKDKEDIWFSQWDESKSVWSDPSNVGLPLNNKYPNFINSISPDGNTVLLGNVYLPDGTTDEGVSISHRTATGWSYPKELIIEDGHNKSKYATFFQSNSQKILLMSIERKGDTYGDRDLYVSFRKSDTEWTKPVNLGPVINTKETEAAAFLSGDDKTMYFTSNGHEGYGGSDIYMSRRLDESWQKWSQPKNLGPAVNTAKDESYFSLNASGDKVFFTHSSGNDTKWDIYSYTLPDKLKPLPVALIKGRVLNSKTNEPIPDVRVFFEDLSTGQEKGIASSHPVTGAFQIVLSSGIRYGYLAEKKGFLSVNKNVDLTNLKEYTEIYTDLYLTPIETGQRISINNIFFDFDKSDLKQESFLELDRLALQMKEHPEMRVEISGHTDNVGSEKYNNDLSHRRAEAVFKYLSEKIGLGLNRMELKNYGESKPIASNATAKGRQLNRRVEFKILAK